MGPVRSVESKEASNALTVEAMALRERVAPGAVADPVDDGLRHEQAGVRRLGQRLVGVEVVALPDPRLRALLGEEVEARIDLILAVGKEEPHVLATSA